MSTEAADLANKLSSGDRPVEEYVEIHEDYLSSLEEMDEIVEKIEIDDLESFKRGMELKGVLSSLFCYAFNNDKEDWREAAEIDGKLGDKLYDFAKGYNRIEDSEVRSVAKYMITCWDHYYYYEDQEKMVRKLAENDKLRKETFENYEGEEKTRYFVVGLHYSVGDNVFGIDSHGNEYRKYQKSCAIQAFYVRGRFNDTIRELEEEGLDIPTLEDYYKKTSVRSDAKESAKVYLSRKDKRVIRGEYTD